MFQQYKNIDTAFKYVRAISFFAIISSISLCFYAVFYTNTKIAAKENKMYVIANGKLFEAMAQEKRTLWPVQIRDHVKMFHFYFYTLEPDEAVIKRNVNSALHLADITASNEYANLNENGYYSSMISASVRQTVEMDSIEVNMNTSPWQFKYIGKLHIRRATATAIRSLITTGTISITEQSDNNPHGLRIEKWKVIENKTLTETTR